MGRLEKSGTAGIVTGNANLLSGRKEEANREIGVPGGFRAPLRPPAYSLPFSVSPGWKKPGSRPRLLAHTGSPGVTFRRGNDKARATFLCGGSLVPVGQGFRIYQTMCVCGEIIIDIRVWGLCHSDNAARVGQRIVPGKWSVLNLEGSP